MKARFVLMLFGGIFFACEDTRAQDVSVEDLKAQIERMERMLEEQQRQIGEQRRQIGELKQTLEDKIKKEDVKEEKIEDVVDKYLKDVETREKLAKLGILPNLNMGYKNGFYLETLDNKYRLHLGGVLQFRYEYQDLEEKDDTSSFSIRRARLLAVGHAFSPNIQYKLQVGADRRVGTSEQNDLTLLDYYVDLRQIPLTMFRVGQFKVPFNRQRLTPIVALQFVDRSIANDEFNLDRDLGVTLHGEPFNERIEYSLGVFNGSGLNRLNDNNEHLYVIRIAYNPFGRFGYEEGDLEYSDKLKVTIAGAGAFSSDAVKDSKGEIIAEDADTSRLVGEVGLKYRGASFLSEVFWRHRDASQISKDSSLQRDSVVDKGFFAQAGYFIVPKKFELTGRYALIAFDDDNPLLVDTKREMTAGLNYFFSGHPSKLQANYTRFVTDQPGDDEEDGVFKLQYQFSF